MSAFPDAADVLVGSIEGKVAAYYVHPNSKNENFTFKCHRENNEVHQINDIKFNPREGTFATCGSDGTFLPVLFVFILEG